MVEKELLRKVIEKINTFESPERKEKSFQALNDLLSKNEKVDSIETKINELEKNIEDLIKAKSELNSKMLRDIKTLKEIADLESEENRKKIKEKRQVEIPIFVLWD